MPRTGRPSKVIQNLKKHISIPIDLVARLELELYSEVEGRIPMGAQQQFFETLLRDHFERQDQEVAQLKARQQDLKEGQAAFAT